MFDITLYYSLTAGVAVAVLFVNLILSAVYRLYLSPIARLRIPGPTLPILTLAYDFYEVVKNGSQVWKIKEWHEKYGPIIRINPHEIHIDDPDFYNEIYVPSGPIKLDKYPWWTALSATPGSIFATNSHELHRVRRTPLNNFFSKKAVTELEPTVREKVERLCSRLAQTSTDEVVRIDCAYMAITIDVICAYCFGEDRRYLDSPDFAAEWKAMLNGAWEQFGLIRHFPWLPFFLQRLPRKLAAALDRQTSMLLEWQDIVRRHARPILWRTADEKIAGSKRTIYHTLRDSDLPAREKTLQRLVEEGQVFLGAGSETTAKALSITTFHILSNPPILAALCAELDKAIPDVQTTPSATELEKLPYLRAVIQEGLRSSHGVTERLPRIRREPLTYKGYTIPAGTPVSSTPYFILSSPHIFPSPLTFNPSRWLDPDHHLDRYFVPSGKGSRSCIGINLAYAELYLTLAAVFRRFEMELYETTGRDVEMRHIFFVAGAPRDSKGVRGSDC